MNSELNKAVVIASAFVLLIAFLGQGYIGGGEHLFNYQKAKTFCEGNSTKQSCLDYPPLFHLLAYPFAFDEKTFWFFSVFLMGFVIPLIFYFLTKNWVSVWLYYSTTSAFYFLIDGVYPQALAMGFVLLVLTLKDWRLQMLAVLGGALSHGHGFYLTLIAFVANRTWIWIEPNLFNFKWDKIFLSCSGVFGIARPAALDTVVAAQDTAYKITYSNILALGTKIFLLPLYIIAFWYSIKNKVRWDLLAVALISLAGGFLYSHRMWYVAPVVLIPAISWWYVSLKKPNKIIFLTFTLVLFIFQIWSWYNYKVLCQ